jgi:uncharacterized membrane protein
MLPLMVTSALAFRVPPPVMQFGGGNPFDGLKNPFADKSDGATTISLTVGFRIGERGPKSVLGQLDDLAANADTNSANGIARLCGDTALLLLRREREWLSCAGTAMHYGDDEEALSAFDRISVNEAAKFDDRDSSATVDAALKSAGLASDSSGPPTMAVVCLVACVMGDREAEVTKGDFSGDARRMKASLQELAAAGNGDEEVFGFELFWVPGEDNEVLDQDEVMLDWPELMPC